MARKESKAIEKPATTPEQEENECISLAFALAKKKLRDGTASSQLITEFVKAGSHKRELELDELRNKNELLQARVKTLEAQRSSEEVAAKALEAMKKYMGREDDEY